MFLADKSIDATTSVLQKTGMNVDHAQAAATGFVTSIGVTFIALATGALVQATTDGVHSLSMLYTWCTDGHLWGYAVTQVVAPGIRGVLAYRNSKKNVAPPAEGANP